MPPCRTMDAGTSCTRGRLSVTPAPGTRHQMISGNLFVLLHQHVRAANRGRVLSAPVDCILSDSTVVNPNGAYLAADSRTPMTGRAIEGPPTLAIEVVSPSRIAAVRDGRCALYPTTTCGTTGWSTARCAWARRSPGRRLVRAGRPASGAAAAALPPSTDLRIDPALSGPERPRAAARRQRGRRSQLVHWLVSGSRKIVRRWEGSFAYVM